MATRIRQIVEWAVIGMASVGILAAGFYYWQHKKSLSPFIFLSSFTGYFSKAHQDLPPPVLSEVETYAKPNIDFKFYHVLAEGEGKKPLSPPIVRILPNSPNQGSKLAAAAQATRPPMHATTSVAASSPLKRLNKTPAHIAKQKTKPASQRIDAILAQQMQQNRAKSPQTRRQLLPAAIDLDEALNAAQSSEQRA